MNDNDTGGGPATWQIILGIVVIILVLIGLFEVIDRVFSWGFILLLAAGFGVWWFLIKKRS